MSEICQFCKKEKQLILSHVIPKCLYDTSQGRLIGITTNAKFDTNPNIQNGYKERLLCIECDNKLGILDKYAKGFFYKTIPNSSVNTCNGFDVHSIASSKFNYEKIYKFFVSVLWRCSVSSKKIFLDKYQQIAFDILTNKIPIQPDLFLPIICKKEICHPSNCATGISAGKFAGKHAYCLKIPGYEITIVVNTKYSSDPDNMNIYKSYFCEDGVKVIKMNALSATDNLLSHQVEYNKRFYKRSA